MRSGNNRFEYNTTFFGAYSCFVREDVANHNCTIVEDGKFVGDSDVGEFWSLFGGYAPIPRDSPCVQESETPPVKLFW